ncbi:NAD(P)H-dependent glycerol-3-phosphate dehydrogenase [Nanoarchaeota archaeon]
MKKITILGAGAFGFAIATVVAGNHADKEIYLFDVQKDHIEHIKKTREHPIFHPDTKLLEHVTVTKTIEKAVPGADLIILAIPSKFLRGAVQNFKSHITKDVVFLNLAKGLEKDSNKRVSEILREELVGVDVGLEFCALSGGMIAREVTLKNPLCADLACEDKDVAKKVGKLLWSDYLHIETSDDLVGVELCGALKNVIAIGAGMFDGLGYGESSKSGFVSVAAEEMQVLAFAMGAKEKTFGPGSQAWFGDLMTTCFGKSRNRELGEVIGSGIPVEDAVRKLISENKSVEGYLTAQVVKKLLDHHEIKAPLLESLYSVLYGKKNPADFIGEFIRA